MKAEDLFVQAMARGVNLPEIARQSEKRVPKLVLFRDADYTVAGRLGYILVEDDKHKDLVANRASGRNTRVIKKPKYTVAELAFASSLIPPNAFRAALYALAGSHTYADELHADLMIEAKRLQRRGDWPDTVISIRGIKEPYLPALTKLLLDDDRHGYVRQFYPAIDRVYAVYMGVRDEVWIRQLASRYVELQFVWHQWLGTAASIMQPKLAEHDEGVSAEPTVKR